MTIIRSLSGVAALMVLNACVTTEQLKTERESSSPNFLEDRCGLCDYSPFKNREEVQNAIERSVGGDPDASLLLAEYVQWQISRDLRNRADRPLALYWLWKSAQQGSGRAREQLAIWLSLDSDELMSLHGCKLLAAELGDSIANSTNVFAKSCSKKLAAQ